MCIHLKEDKNSIWHKTYFILLQMDFCIKLCIAISLLENFQAQK